MTSPFRKTQDIIFEVETGDITLPDHTNKRMYYIKPNADGTPGAVAAAAFVAGTAIAGEAGNSVMQGLALNFNIPGAWVFWSESDNPSAKHCVSDAFEVLVWERGTVRR